MNYSPPGRITFATFPHPTQPLDLIGGNFKHLVLTISSLGCNLDLPPRGDQTFLGGSWLRTFQHSIFQCVWHETCPKLFMKQQTLWSNDLGETWGWAKLNLLLYCRTFGKLQSPWTEWTSREESQAWLPKFLWSLNTLPQTNEENWADKEQTD